MEKFLETYNLPTLNQEEIENLNRPTISKEIKLVIKNLLTQKSPDGFSGEFYQPVKGQLMPILLKLFSKIKEEGKLPNLFYMASITCPEKDTKRKENYRSVFLLTTDAKILKKILAN